MPFKEAWLHTISRKCLKTDNTLKVFETTNINLCETKFVYSLEFTSNSSDYSLLQMASGGKKRNYSNEYTNLVSHRFILVVSNTFSVLSVLRHFLLIV